MKMLELASKIKSARKENVELKKKYAGYFIRRGREEKKIDFIRRIAIGVVLEVNYSITLSNMIREIKFLIRKCDIGINDAFLMKTLIFENSGIIIDGNLFYISEENRVLARNILRNAEIEILSAGGKMEKTELFSLIRGKTTRLLSEKTLYSSLYNKGNLRWKTKEKKTMIFIKE